MWQHPTLPFTISDSTADVDVVAVHAFLRESYWSKGIPFDVQERAIEGSHCFSLFDGEGKQGGFARVVTDHATFAYVADVYVLEAHRGLGLGKWLMEVILAHPDLQGLKRWLLATRDMHPLYRQFGFDALDEPQKIMQLRPRRTYE